MSLPQLKQVSDTVLGVSLDGVSGYTGPPPSCSCHAKQRLMSVEYNRCGLDSKKINLIYMEDPEEIAACVEFHL